VAYCPAKRGKGKYPSTLLLANQVRPRNCTEWRAGTNIAVVEV
jgi:hypothetical protein